MLSGRLQQLRERLEALRERPPGTAGWARRVLDWFGGDSGPVALPTLEVLDRELDRVGIHTSADAKLLRELGVQRGLAGRLSRGLTERTSMALAEVERALVWAEREQRSGRLDRREEARLERGLAQLSRAVRVADLFTEPVVEGGAPFEVLPGARRRTGVPNDPRLAIARLWVERARQNIGDLAQKRRDLNAAHELLLRTDSAPDRDLARALRLEVAGARERVRPLPVVRSLHDQSRHLRLLARRDPALAYRSVLGLYEGALEAGDEAVARVARQGVEALLPEPDSLRQLVERRGRAAVDAPPSLAGGEAPSGQTWVHGSDLDRADERLLEVAFELDDERLEAFELAAGCARYFDVEETLAEEVVAADFEPVRPKARRVSYPTQRMTFEHTHSLDELPNFVIGNPRTLLHDLASNRQLVRAYLEEVPAPLPRAVKRTAVRVYVCDASGSMHGARARFRDAVVIAELNNLRVRARRGLPFDPLYLSFFNDTPSDLMRIDSAADASRNIVRLFQASPAQGQTNISLALLSAFDAISRAQGKDPFLAKATVVLVTDGEDAVDLELIRKARSPIDGLRISLSFISLGEENRDLKALAKDQREHGERVFYHHLTDAEIAGARTEFDSQWRTLLPRDVPVAPGAMERLLPHLEALEALAASREVVAPPRLAQSFDAVFPEPVAQAKADTQAGAQAAGLVSAVAEAAAVAPFDGRADEAVELLGHLLGQYEVAMADYLALAATPTPALAQALRKVRLLCRPFG